MPRFSEAIQFSQDAAPADAGWGDFLFDLGAQIAFLEDQSKKTTVLLILPVVDMATPIIALGYLHKKLNKQNQGGLSLDFFRNLPLGTPLIYRSVEGSQHASFDGLTKYIDRSFRPAKEIECVVVRVQSFKKGRGSKILLPNQLHQLTVVSADQGISESDLGKDADGINKFTRAILGPTSNMSTVVDSVWMIGKFAELQWELMSVPLHAKDKAGTFNDLLRADQLVKAREPAFSRLIASFGGQLDYQDATSTARLAIFRESASYLKHHHNYDGGSKIALMDYSDRHLDEVIESYNQKYYRRLEDLNFNAANRIENTVCAGFLEVA